MAAPWARALPELFFTALEGRGTMLVRNARFSSAWASAAARWGGLAALLGGVLGTAYHLTWGVLVSLFAGPARYYEPGPVVELYGLLLLSVAPPLCALGLFGLCGVLASRSGRLGGLALAGAAAGAASVASWLALGGYAVAGGIASWPWPAAAGYPSRADALALTGMAGWVAGFLLVGVAALGLPVPGRLRALPFAAAALWPAGFAAALLLLPDAQGPNGYGVDDPRLGLVRTLAGALPFLGSALLGLVLGALRRRGELAVAGAALETSLTVEEAERTLSALAAKGRLEVRVARGRLLYSLRGGDG